MSDCGKITTNSLPRPKPWLWALDTTAMELHQAFNKGQADAKSALRGHSRRFYLRKHIEDLRDHGGRQAQTIVAHKEG
jgi:hypothetical protein